MLVDLRHAWRSVLRMPGLSTVVVLSLAAGIGINTVVFSWVQARILDPIPGVADGAEVRLIEPRSDAGLYIGTAWPEFRDMREGLRAFSDLFAARMAPLYVGPPGSVERVVGLLVSDNYFSALGVRPAIGRFFRPDEVQHAGREAVAVISHRLWQTHLHGVPDVIGRSVRVNARELAVIGVTPPEFQGTTVGLQFDIWVPATMAPQLMRASRELEDRGVRAYGVMGRFREDATPAGAQRELDAFMQQLARTYPASNGGVTAEILAFHEPPRGPQRMLNVGLLALQAMMLLLLLAVCGNVANLLLARASARQGEMAVRLSLGAPRWRIGWLLLAESGLLAVAGAALGAAMAVWGTRALLILPMTGFPLRFETQIDATGLAFAAALGAACALLFGAAPALHLARLAPHGSRLRGPAAPGALRHILMGTQVALAVMVLIVAALFVRAFAESRWADPGFQRERLMLAGYDLSGRAAEAPFLTDLARRALERVQELPFVESAAIAASVPLDIHGLPSRAFVLEGQARSDGQPDVALMNVVTPGYFAAMGVPIVSGDDFPRLTDDRATRHVIVNEAFVRRYVTGGEPLGRRLTARGVTYTIGGVVRNSVSNAFGEPPTPVLYFSYRDLPQPRGEIHVRLQPGFPATVRQDIGRAMRDVDAELPVFNIRSMDEHVDTNLIFRRIPAQMFAVLGPMLLALAAIGISAVVSYTVSRRTREIGIQLALGATAGRVVRRFVVENLRVAGTGALIGWSIAFAVAIVVLPAGRFDVAVFAAVPVAIVGVAALACWLPARRAAAVDPAIALRAE